MKLKILVNSTYNEETALVDIDKKKIIIAGDIDNYKKIMGFLEALKYLSIDYVLDSSQKITPDQEMFNTCGFCDMTPPDDIW